MDGRSPGAVNNAPIYLSTNACALAVPLPLMLLESQRASERSDVVPGPFEVSFGRHTPVAVLCFSVAGSRASRDVPRRPLEPTTQPRRTFRHAKDSVPEALRPQSNG